MAQTTTEAVEVVIPALVPITGVWVYTRDGVQTGEEGLSGGEVVEPA